ncbi:MAG: ribonuclease HI [Odoribacter sp.]|nr:ribonuclease HI [Odoribacter sp.]
MANEIIIYTDGAARGNPGPGGYGAVLISGRHRLEKSEGYKLTTNNRMELMAVIAGLESLKIPGSIVVVYTDSKYVADAVNKGWLFQWESKAFKKKKNPDLWLRLLKTYRTHDVKFIWIKGHASNPENERCDQLAVEASKRSFLLEDTGYNPEEDNSIQFI